MNCYPHKIVSLTSITICNPFTITCNCSVVKVIWKIIMYEEWVVILDKLMLYINWVWLVIVCACLFVCVYACVALCGSVCVSLCVYVCVRERDRERKNTCEYTRGHEWEAYNTIIRSTATHLLPHIIVSLTHLPVLQSVILSSSLSIAVHS